MSKIIIAPNSFRDCIDTFTVAQAIEIGLRKVLPDIEILKLPIADGGDLTLDVLINVLGGDILYVPVKDPLGRSIIAKYGILPDGNTAIIEMAAATGIRLISKDLLDPMNTTSYGAGQLIHHALNQGCRKLIIGLGGSATVDGGSGMLHALGVKLLDCHGQNISNGGVGLSQLDRLDITGMDPRIKETEIIVACDVENVLVGPYGSALVFGPQKGADSAMIKILDSNLFKFADIINRDLQKNVFSIPYGGANGGMGAALYAFLNAKLERGIDLILRYIGFENLLSGCKLIITAEGKIDEQTLSGKAPYGIAQAARRSNIPIVAIVGQVDNKVKLDDLSIFNAIFPLYKKSMSIEYAINNAPLLVSLTAERVGKLFIDEKL
ncbi:glycerate kinase [Desulfobacula phenolica]|uniref:Glycerate kinase n=1 Tax=Desulfobacula phenolica TaxID=90732 RepID=A0A1H2ECC1_9BACT|nr:glycerate kinase [Desulfobacula phenolica]SDT92787.1 glycerate kinase [Desulfobacula phenolica]